MGRAVCGAGEELLARHHLATLVRALAASVDGKDVAAAVDLLGAAQVEVRGHRGSEDGCARSWLTRVWTDPGEYRHDLSALAVAPGDGVGAWCARAGYTRWFLGRSPVVHTVGEWDLVADAPVGGGDWTIRLLTVTRTWSRDG